MQKRRTNHFNIVINGNQFENVFLGKKNQKKFSAIYYSTRQGVL
ncbi:MAG: hypothetical protein RLZZ546_2347, partial [Bacteroidota bacterium]